ncbi:MAG: GNAT family N-acetyltransferase, partial [Planctomycetota bacterium]
MGSLGLKRFHLRRARPADTQELARLEASCFPHSDQFPLATWVRLLQSPSVFTLIAETDPGSPRAAITWLLRRGSQVARMYSLAVHPGDRGQGLAKRLIADSLRQLPRRIQTCS